MASKTFSSSAAAPHQRVRLAAIFQSSHRVGVWFSGDERGDGAARGAGCLHAGDQVQLHRHQVSFLADAKSSLGDATSSLGGAKSSLGDATSSLGDTKSSLGDATSSLGGAKSSLGDATSSLGDTKSSLGDVKSLLGDSKSASICCTRASRCPPSPKSSPCGRRPPSSMWIAMTSRRCAVSTAAASQTRCAPTPLHPRWVTLRSRWVTLRSRWVTLRARWVTLRARWVTLRSRWVTLRARWVMLRARG
jgi:hypothetical protein